MTTPTLPAAAPELCHRTGAPTTPAGLRRAAGRDILAVSPGVVPFGLMLGVTIVALDAGRVAGLLGAALVFGGSAQLTTITVLHLGSGLLAALVSGIVVNARILLYGAALEARFRGQPRWFRLLGPAFIQDQTYLSATARPGLGAREFRRYWGWLSGLLLVVWTASVAAGIALAPLLPPLPHLGLVGAALFVAMLAPKVVDRASVVAVLAAGVTAFLVARALPDLGILVGTAAGVTAAVATTRRAR